MDKKHCILLKRYKAVLKNGKEIELDLEPEKWYYFYCQEEAYLLLAVRNLADRIDIGEIKEIVPYFRLKETKEEVGPIVIDA